MNYISCKAIDFIIILLTYITISFLTAYYNFYKDNNSTGLIKKSFLSSFVALLLTPLFFESIGNDLLKRILTESYSFYDYILFAAYATIISLAGKKIIDNMLTNLNLNDVEKKIEEQKEKQEEQESIQEDIILKQINYDFEENEGSELRLIFNILTSISSSSRESISVNESNINLIEKLHKQRYINTYGKVVTGDLHCSITRLGKKYLEEVSLKITP